MAGKRNFRVPRLQGVALWAPIAALLFVGFVTTLIDLARLPHEEASRANAQRQRFVVNPTTGEISLGVGGSGVNGHEEQFDVGTAEDTPTAEEPTETPHETAEPATPTEEPLPEGMPTLRTEPIIANLTAPPHTNDSLVSAPAPEVTEVVEGLQLPKRGDKDVIPSKLYAHPFKRKPEQVLVSFVVMDAGIDPQSVSLLVGLPKEITVAYSPYVRGESYSEHLRALGHEVWTMLPTMSDRYPSDDPGPMGIIARMPAEEVVRRLREVLGAVRGSVGLVLPPNEMISVQKNALAPALAEINKRGLLVLSTHPSRNIDQIATDKTLVPIIRRADLVLDPEPNESQIRSKLAGLVAAATEKGEYLVVLSARPQSLQLLADWLKENPFVEPMTLAPLSAMYQAREVPEAAEEKKEEGGGHGGGEKKEKPKPKAKKKEKPLPQDKYLKPAGKEEGGGGHGGGH